MVDVDVVEVGEVVVLGVVAVIVVDVVDGGGGGAVLDVDDANSQAPDTQSPGGDAITP